MAAELVALKVDVILASGAGAPGAALAATSSIPIIMTATGDPERFVKNLARPEGNITGFSQNFAETSSKYVELLRVLLPKLRRVSVIVSDPRQNRASLDRIRAAAKTSGVTVSEATSANAVELEPALLAVASSKSEALIVVPDPVFGVLMPQITKFAGEHRLPTMFGNSIYVELGGLMSYGVAPPALYYRAATYVDKIFKGAKISELPVEFPTRIELTINMKTAKAIGVNIGQELRLRADRLIE